MSCLEQPGLKRLCPWISAGEQGNQAWAACCPALPCPSSNSPAVKPKKNLRVWRARWRALSLCIYRAPLNLTSRTEGSEKNSAPRELTINSAPSQRRTGREIAHRARRVDARECVLVLVFQRVLCSRDSHHLAGQKPNSGCERRFDRARTWINPTPPAEPVCSRSSPPSWHHAPAASSLVDHAHSAQLA